MRISAQNYLVVKVAHTVSSEFTAVIPDISTWSAWHALSSLYIQLCAAHFIERLSFGEPQELLLELSLCSKLVQHVSSQERAFTPLISIPLRQQHLSELWEQVVALQLKLVIKKPPVNIIIHSLIRDAFIIINRRQKIMSYELKIIVKVYLIRLKSILDFSPL